MDKDAGAVRRLFLFGRLEVFVLTRFLHAEPVSTSLENAIETVVPKERPSHMITEIAQIDVKPGTEKDFEAAVAKARPLFLRAKGGKGFELHKSIDKPSRYRLMAKWETLENHTVDFRGSEDFTAWRALVGQYFAAPPEVEHTETVLTT
jgi:heme-degrading monooxygenase HmoA